MSHLYPIFLRRTPRSLKFFAGYINANGETVIPPSFEDAGAFRDGQAPVQSRGLWGIIDAEGRHLFSCQWHYPTRFVNGIATVRKKRRSKPELRGYLRPDGSWLVEPKYAMAADFSCGMAQVFDGASYGFINESGEEAIPLVFKEARAFGEDLASVKLDAKWGYIDRTGASVINPRFDAAMPFREGVARVRVGERWGFIDRTGEFVIPPAYAMVYDMHLGMAAAAPERKETMGFINKDGDLVIEPEYRHVRSFHEGFACVTPANQRCSHFVDLNGARAFDGEFDSAESFYMNRALVKTEETIAYVDPTGNVVWQAPLVDRLFLAF